MKGSKENVSDSKRMLEMHNKCITYICVEISSESS